MARRSAACNCLVAHCHLPPYHSSILYLPPWMSLSLAPTLLTPRLHSFDDDDRLARATPLRQLFKYRFSAGASRPALSKDRENELLQQAILNLLSSEVDTVQQWWTYCIGGFFLPWISAAEAFDSFLVEQYIQFLYHRCWLRTANRDTLQALADAQRLIYRFCENIPSQTNIFGAGDGTDSSLTGSDCSIVQDGSGNSSSEIDDGTNLDRVVPTPCKTIKKPQQYRFVESSGEESSGAESWTGGEYEPETEEERIPQLSKKPHPKKPPLKLPQTEHELENFCGKLVNLVDEFWAGDEKGHLVLPQLITEVRILKIVLGTKTATKKILEPFKKSGLGARLQARTARGIGFESVHPGVALSYQKHDWPYIFGEILSKVLDVDPLAAKIENLPAIVPYVHDNSDGFDAEHFVRFLGKHPEHLLLRAYPIAVLAFTGGRIFTQIYTAHVAACMHKAGYLIDPQWDPGQLYRCIAGIHLFRNIATMERAGLDPHFTLQLKLSRFYRDFVQIVNEAVYHRLQGPSPRLETLLDQLNQLYEDPYGETQKRRNQKRAAKKRKREEGKAEGEEAIGGGRRKGRNKKKKKKKRADPGIDSDGDVHMVKPDEEASSEGTTWGEMPIVDDESLSEGSIWSGMAASAAHSLTFACKKWATGSGVCAQKAFCRLSRQALGRVD
ncbi:hypothetical protein C8F01DRAFT_1078901 [Mycena amicta]|nr:hypothetical protein C8F01DRAFT_1078901 [Mycena amicta]